ncbi:MAG: hypothetical protein JWO89_3152 [Verrucomicrobiaceae bacterium]|nr:hypothetical protein [Verrucomicrobiaceae bacterium]
MDKTTFLSRLQKVTVANRDVAARYVSNYLPESNLYIIRLTQSFDETLEPWRIHLPDLIHFHMEG